MQTKSLINSFALAFVIGVVTFLLPEAAKGAPPSQGPPFTVYLPVILKQDMITIVVDDFSPQPRAGDPSPFPNDMGGDGGRIDGPGSGTVERDNGVVTATITGGIDTWIGVWTSLNHPIRDCKPLNFSSIFPSQIISQGHIRSLRIHIRDGRGTFQIQLKKGENDYCPPQVTKLPKEYILNGGPQVISFDLPSNLGEIGSLNWQVKGNPGDFVVVDQVELIANLPQLDLPKRAFLQSYAQLLANWDPASGLTRDHAYLIANEFDNISASGMQAAAAMMAWRLGFISLASATAIVTKTTQALLALPRCHGLWPHFVKNGQIVSGTEFSSIDSVIALVALLEAREALGLETTAVKQILMSIDWDALIFNGSIGHGYVTDCSQPIKQGDKEAIWKDFGTESWLVNLGYAAKNGKVTIMDSTPPTSNGSGFIDELTWLLIPVPPIADIFGINWPAYRQVAVDRQLSYYPNQHHPCYEPLKLFGLSAAQVPDLSTVPPPPPDQSYQAFGVGGETPEGIKVPPNDGSNLPWLRHAVITPHYAAMIASLRPDQALALWGWLEARRLFTPLNNVESLMFVDEPTCQKIVWNSLKGSWNLSLQTLGWGRFLAGDNYPLHNAMWSNDLLKQGYTTLCPSCSIP